MCKTLAHLNFLLNTYDLINVFIREYRDKNLKNEKIPVLDFKRETFNVKKDEVNKIEYDEAVNAGAEFVEISTETTKNYLKKMISSVGDYEIGWGQNGGTFIYEKGTAPRDSPRL